MNGSAILFSVFDPKIGPVPFFTYGDLTLEEANEIAYKSQLAVYKMTESFNLDSSQAVLPFFKFRKVGFVFLFHVPSAVTKEKCVASISIVVPMEHQISFYKHVLAIRPRIESLAKKISETYTYGPNTVFPDEIKQELASYRQFEEKDQSEQAAEHALWLLKEIKKDVDKFYLPLITNRPLAVSSSNSDKISRAMIGLEFLAPHRYLRKKIVDSPDQTEIKDADVIGTTTQQLTTQDVTIINLDKRAVQGGMTNPHVKKIVKDFQKSKPHELKDKVINALEEILLVANLLVDACGKLLPEERDKEIKEIQAKYNQFLIETAGQIAADWNPLISDLIKASVEKKVLDWMSDI